MFQGYNFMPCDYSLRTVPRRPLKTQMCLRLSHTENIEIYYIFSFLFYLHYYNIYASQATRDYCRLSHDYSPTIPRLPCDYSGHAQGAARKFARSFGEGVPLVWVADLAAGTPGGRGRRWLGGQQAAPRTCERGRGWRYQGGTGNTSICAGIAL